MKRIFTSLGILFMATLQSASIYAQQQASAKRPLPPPQDDPRMFKIFQFPPDKIPRIDGDADDWDMVPDSFAIGMDQLHDDNKRMLKPDPKNLDAKVKIGWVKGENRLNFLYQAYDNYWDFSLPDLHNDIFELVVDADRSGGTFINELHNTEGIDQNEAYFSFHGVHAQNYHIFTPALNKDWAMVWGGHPWVKDLPYANHAYKYNFKPGQSGKLTLEFFITPFDYAGAEGPVRSVESNLYDNKLISLCFAILDYDDVNDKSKQTFWNLSKEHKMYGDADYMLPFKLMPLDDRYKKPIEADWSFKVVDMNRRVVAFIDQSIGKVTSWKWDFGDGSTSTEQYPYHQYKRGGKYVVVLDIEGPAGKSRRSKVWDVAVQ